MRRFRLPAWRESEVESVFGEDAHPVAVVLDLAVGFVLWIVVPLACAIVELPIAAVRSLFSSTRYVEATCRWPSELTILWRTSKEHAAAAADDVVRQLAEGYDLRPSGAEFVSMTRPPGLEDLSS